MELRTPDRRQLLPDQLGSCSSTVDNSYLLWAGDFDGDGRLDLLISFVDDGPVDLFLSSAASGTQIVGLAGRFLPPPDPGECDTTGWLETLESQAGNPGARSRATIGNKDGEEHTR